MNKTNSQNHEFDQAALSIARHFYKKTPSLKKCHSGTNYCVILSFDDGTADRVLKLSNRNSWAIEFERHLYPAMRLRDLPVPEIEFSHLDYPEPAEPFIVMPKFSDHTLDALWYKNRSATIQAFEKSSQFIPDLHERFSEAFKSFLTLKALDGKLAEQQKNYERTLDLNPVWEKDPDLAQQIERHLETLRKPNTKRLLHGALHTQNIMATSSGEICVIDLGESIGMSSPLKDLSALLKGARNQEQVNAAVKGYGGVTNVDVQGLCFWEFFDGLHSMISHMRLFPDAEYTQSRITQIRLILKRGSLLPPL